jgi:hypothetical protein
MRSATFRAIEHSSIAEDMMGLLSRCAASITRLRAQPWSNLAKLLTPLVTSMSGHPKEAVRPNIGDMRGQPSMLDVFSY